MKTALFIIPFISLLIAAIGTAVGSAFTEISWVTYVSWATSLAFLALWVSLDLAGFKRFFARKGAKYGASSGATVILGVLIITGLAFLGSKPRFNKSFDVTKAGINTLSEQSIKIMKGLGEKKSTIDVKAFFQDEQQKSQFQDLLTLYLRVSDSLKVSYMNPQINPTDAIALNITSPNTVIFNFGSQEARITTFTEEKITNALIKVIKGGVKRIYFTSGHGEGSLRDSEPDAYKAVVEELESNKYKVEEVSLFESGGVPKDADLLVIAGPKYDFKKEEITLVDQYLEKGGALLIMVDAMVPTAEINRLMTSYGLSFNEDLLILRPDDPRAQLLGQNNAIVSKFDKMNPVTKDFAGQQSLVVVMSNTRSIDIESENKLSLKTSLVGETADIVIKVKGVRSQSDLGSISEDRVESGSFGVIAVASGRVPGVNMASNDEANSEAKSDVSSKTADADEMKKEVRIVAVGSAQFASNLGAQRAEHRDLFMNMANYLLQDEDFISIRPNSMEKGTIDLSSSSSQLSLVLLAFIYPFVFLGGGVLFWLKRRKA